MSLSNNVTVQISIRCVIGLALIKADPHTHTHSLAHLPLFIYHLQNGKGRDDGWSVDVSEEAVKARIEDLSSHISTLTLTSELEKTNLERVDMFYKMIEVSWRCLNMTRLQNHLTSENFIAIHSNMQVVMYRSGFLRLGMKACSNY